MPRVDELVLAPLRLPLSSTSLMAEEPMSRPTRFLDFSEQQDFAPPKKFKRLGAFTFGYFGWLSK